MSKRKKKQKLAGNRSKKSVRHTTHRRRKQNRSGGGRAVFLGVSKQTVRTSAIREALVSREIFEKGMGPVVIARDLPNGRIVLGVFLVDAHCLGVKNAFFSMCPAIDYRDVIDRISGEGEWNRADPAYARKLVEDAIAYARDLGFEPHADFRDAAVVLGDIDASACSETFEFGEDGMPLYVSGPDESPAAIRRILAQLRRRCGDDGFHYLLGVDALEDLEFFGEPELDEDALPDSE